MQQQPTQQQNGIPAHILAQQQLLQQQQRQQQLQHQQQLLAQQQQQQLQQQQLAQQQQQQQQLAQQQSNQNVTQSQPSTIPISSQSTQQPPQLSQQLSQQQLIQQQLQQQMLQQQMQIHPTNTLTSIQQQYLLEQYDDLLKHVSLVRSNVSDFFNSFIDEAKTQQTVVNKEEMKKRLKKAMEQLFTSIGVIDKVSHKISSYSFQISSSNFSTQEALWAYSTGVYDSKNILAQLELRTENYWRSTTSYKSEKALSKLEDKLKQSFPIIFQEEEESSSLSKKRKQITNATLTNNTSSISSTTTPSPLFKLPSTPLITTTPLSYDYFTNIERVIHSQRQESALEIFEIQKQSSGAPKGLFVECPDVFKCLICFGIPNDKKECFTIDRISFFGIKENFDSLWASSKYNIFKKISENSFEAISYYSANPNGSVLKSILNWIWSFRGLFLEECKGCNDILHLDSTQYLYLPPSFRTFDNNFTPYHPSCYQNSLNSNKEKESNKEIKSNINGIL